MADPETQYQPLVSTPSQETAINIPAQGGRSTRAYKVAGITVLACILIAGQAAIAYFLLSQSNDIKSLEKQNNDLQVQMTQGKSVSVPMRAHMPINALADLMDVSEDKVSPPKKSGKTVTTECQREASGLKSGPLPGFRPQCDEQGLYRPLQCFMRRCWCVDPTSGLESPDGEASCGANLRIGGHAKMLSLADIDA